MRSTIAHERRGFSDHGVDQFLVWSEGPPGRFELHEGAVVKMEAERRAHLLAKGWAYRSLGDAISGARVLFTAYPNGATVRISRKTVFEPDALVRCGPPMPSSALEVTDPVIVVEVLSPSTASVDFGLRLEGYFSAPSVSHSLIVDADRRKLVHHKRGVGDLIETRLLGEGLLRLDPPGLELEVESLFGPA
jgi:Uma2 family endonuclease